MSRLNESPRLTQSPSVRGPRAAPSRSLPRVPSSAHATLPELPDESERPSPGTPSDISVDNLSLPDNVRDLRARAADLRRMRAASTEQVMAGHEATSMTSPPAAEAVPSAVGPAPPASVHTQAFREGEWEGANEHEVTEALHSRLADASSMRDTNLDAPTMPDFRADDPQASRPPSAELQHGDEALERPELHVSTAHGHEETHERAARVSPLPTRRASSHAVSPVPQPALRSAAPLPAMIQTREIRYDAGRRQRAAGDRAEAQPPTELPEVRRAASLDAAAEPTDAPAPVLHSVTAEDVQGPIEAPATAAAEMALPPPPAPLFSDVTSPTRRRRESRRARSRRSAENPLLAALSLQAPAGPGGLFPSLYGYFSDEPAPTSLRPAAVAYGAGDGRVHATPWPVATPARAGTSGASHQTGRNERILDAGPSVSNLQPVSTGLHMSPGAESRAEAARLRNLSIQPGSITFPAGTLSAVGPPPQQGAQLSRRYEENSVLSFSWMISHVAELVEELESGQLKNEAWSLKPLFGNEQWRVELDRRPVALPIDESGAFSLRDEAHGLQHTMVLSITCLALSSLTFPAELPTQLMVGFRTAKRLETAPRTLDSEFLWRTFVPFTFSGQHDTFTLEALPPLGELVADAQIAEADAFDIVVQIATGPSVLPERDATMSATHGAMRLPFEAPDTVSVPRSLLQSLAALVDDAATGDLMIMVREKGFEQHPSFELAESVGLRTFVQPWPTGTPLPADGENCTVFVRDRVLWAHASVLRARSEFFATMLDSSFAEGTQFETSSILNRTRDSRRPFRQLRVPDADYVTMYWFLRYLYTEEVQLLRDEDIQAVTLDDHWILGQEAPAARPDWKWRRVGDLDDLDESDAVDVSADASLERQGSRLLRPISTAANPVLSDASRDDGRVRARSAAGTGLADPHPHPPMLPVPPASALSLYRIAHRYHVPPLCELATAHIISLLTPQNATNYLLCTALFEQLQRAIQNYICMSTTARSNTVQHWHDVSSSAEFELCCDQVSAGEWGPSAGRALASLMRNLRQALPR